MTWSDVPRDHWARAAIDFVGATNAWMRDREKPDADGTYRFRPDALERRGLFARALVRGFAPDAEPDPELEFLLSSTSASSGSSTWRSPPDGWCPTSKATSVPAIR